MAVQATILHHRALAWADFMKSAMLSFSICLALATLPTALTKLTATSLSRDARWQCRQNVFAAHCLVAQFYFSSVPVTLKGGSTTRMN